MKISLIAVVSLISVLFLSGLLKSSAQDSPKTIDRWIDYPFDSSQPVGSAKNPAVILPATTAALLGDLPAARRAEEFVIVPVSELKKVSDEPLTRMVIYPVIKHLPGVKSFD